MLEKNIYYGKIFKGTSKKNGDEYYVIHYMEEDGTCQKEYIEKQTYDKIETKKIKTNEKRIGVFGLNQYNRGILTDIK